MKSCSIFFLFLQFLLLAGIPSHSATIGDYRTKASGNWNQIAIWEYYNGSSWVNATVVPTFSDDDIDIRSGYSVTVTAGVTIDQTGVAGTLTVNAGITLTINDGSGTDLSVSGIVYVNGILQNNGSVSSSTSEMIFNNGALYRHNYNGGNIAGATWNDGSTCEVTGITSSLSILNTDQSFYHFKWNCSLQTAETNCAGNLQVIRGNFIMAHTGTNGKLKLGESADYTLAIAGNWEHQGGTLNLGGGSSYAYINLSGNFSMSGGKVTELNSTGYVSKISFVKQGVQTYSKSAGTFENNIDFDIINGCTLDVGNSIVDGSLGQFSVSSGSTLKTSNPGGISTSGASGSIQTTSRYYSFAANYHYCASGTQSTGNGIPSPLNGKMVIGSAAGATNLTLTNGSVTINGTLLLISGPSSNSTIVSGTVVFGAAAALEYQGMSAQTITLKEWPVSSPPFNVTINNTFGVVMNSNRTITGTLTLALGSLSIASNILTLNGHLVKTSGNLAGGAGSDIIVGGTAPSAIDLPEVTLNNLLLNRVSGMRLIGNVTIHGTMTMTAGNLTLAPLKSMSYLTGSRLKYNSTINQVTNAEEFPVAAGPPSLEVDKPAGISLSLGFSRTLSENLYRTSGIFSLGSNTLTLNGLISGSDGTLTGGNTSSLIFNGSGASTTLPEVTLLNLTINRTLGIYLGGVVTIQGTLDLALGNLYINGSHLVVNGMIQYTGGSLSGNPASILSVNGTSGLQSLEPLTLHTLNLDRLAGISLAGDVQVVNTLSIMNGQINRNGYLLYGPAATLRYSGTNQQTTSDEEFPGENGPCNLAINNPAGVVLHDSHALPGNVELAAGPFNLNSKTLALCGTFIQMAGTLEGGDQCSIHFMPGAIPGTLPPVSLENLVIDRLQGVFSIGNSTVWGTLELVNGPFTLAGTGILSLMGFPVTGNTMNFTGSPFSGLYIGGNEPGWVTPSGLSVIGFLAIDNTQGVSLAGNLVIDARLSVFKSFEMFDFDISGNGMAKILAGARLISGHPNGIAGNIQLSGPMMVDAAVDYEFNGLEDQSTGFLPTNPPFTIRNLTVSNTGTHNVTLNSDITLTGNLEIADGAKFTIDLPFIMTVETDVVVH